MPSLHILGGRSAQLFAYEMPLNWNMVSDYQQLNQYGRRIESKQDDETKEFQTKQRLHSPETMQRKKKGFQMWKKNGEKNKPQKSQWATWPTISTFISQDLQVLGKQCNSNRGRGSAKQNSSPPLQSFRGFFGKGRRRRRPFRLPFFLGGSGSAGDIKWKALSRCGTSWAHFLCMQQQQLQGLESEKRKAQDNHEPWWHITWHPARTGQGVGISSSSSSIHPCMHLLVPENRHDEPSAKAANIQGGPGFVLWVLKTWTAFQKAICHCRP